MLPSLRLPLLATLLIFLVAVSAQAKITASVAEIVQNPDRYDGKVVTVSGTIASYRERVSARGNPYTTFRLVDAGVSVAVFAWKHHGLWDGLRVRATGVFQKIRRVGRYTFYNEIEAQRIEVIH